MVEYTVERTPQKQQQEQKGGSSSGGSSSGGGGGGGGGGGCGGNNRRIEGGFENEPSLSSVMKQNRKSVQERYHSHRVSQPLLCIDLEPLKSLCPREKEEEETEKEAAPSPLIPATMPLL